MAFNFSGAHGAVKSAFAKGTEATGGLIGKTFRGAKNVVGAGLGTVTGAVHGMASRPGAFLKGTAALAALAAIAGTAAYVLRKPRKQDHPIEPPSVDFAPPMPDMAGMQQQTMMGMAPVEGPQVARVQERRQGGMSGPGIGA